MSRPAEEWRVKTDAQWFWALASMGPRAGSG
jgi:hypothetical protein